MPIRVPVSSWYTGHLPSRGSKVPFSLDIVEELWLVSLKIGSVVDLKQNEIFYSFWDKMCIASPLPSQIIMVLFCDGKKRVF
jgi:hypothetical protein